MSAETRWNTIADSLEFYLRNWMILVKVCKDNRVETDQKIMMKVKDKALKKTTQGYLEQMKPIAVALDYVQRESTLTNDAAGLVETER